MLERGHVDVLAVYTANAGYRMDVLRKVGGFDESLKTSEDSDISARIRAHGGRIMYVPTAVVRHRHYESLIKVVREPYIRAQNMFQFYLKERRIPPVFPMPILYIFLLLVSLPFLYKHVAVLTIVALVLPMGLYVWWIARAIRERRLEYIVYGYIQLVVESAVIVGLIKSILGTPLHSSREPLLATKNPK
jgi:GT2 family glycosyltransferase